MVHNLNELIKDIIVFNLSGKDFCANTKDIIAILKLEEINIENEFSRGDLPFFLKDNITIPVIDLYKQFNLKPDAITHETRVLVFEIENNRFGFLVGKVIEILTFNGISLSLIKFETSENPYITGILKYENHEIYLPDFNAIINENLKKD